MELWIKKDGKCFFWAKSLNEMSELYMDSYNALLEVLF